MTEPRLTGAHRAIFGDHTLDAWHGWLDRQLRDRSGAGLEAITFTAGDIGAVVGVRLTDGRTAVLKGHRVGTVPGRLRAIVALQRHLAATGFGAAEPLSDPWSADGVWCTLERPLPLDRTGSPHTPAGRAAMAAGLAEQIARLRGMDGAALGPGRPAWADWDHGAWPRPHDPIFDFTRTIPGFEWLDASATAAAATLREAADRPPVIGHSDWVWQNVCVRGDRVVAAVDWDSLVWAPEAAIVGLVAGAFTQGAAEPPHSPDRAAAEAFVTDYEAAAGRAFEAVERRLCAAAITWVRCYNARCELDNRERRGMTLPAGSSLEQLESERG